MTTLESIHQALYEWADKQLPITVIWADQGEKRPPKPYATLDLRAPTKVGDDEIRPQADGTLKVVGTREATIEVNVFGSGAFIKMLDLQTSLELPSVQEALRKLGVTYVSSSRVRDITIALDTRFETRAQMDVLIRLASVIVDADTGAIETVNLTDSLDGSTEIINP